MSESFAHADLHGGSFVFGEVRTSELTEARREVEEWAEELLVEQRETWARMRQLDREKPLPDRRRAKPRPVTREECRAKSREIRIKRERDSNYWNDLIASHPQY